MEQNKELTFEVMVTFPDLLDKKIQEYNAMFGTDFVINEIIDDEVQFCKIHVSKYKTSDIFDLGYSLAVLQYRLRQNGEISW